MYFTHRRSIVATLFLCTIAAFPALAQSPAVGEPLTLTDAIGAALTGNPRLEVYSWSVRAAESRSLQAGLRPNPELEVEFEEIRFSDGSDSESFSFDTVGALTEREVEGGADSGIDDTEITVSLSHIVELGKKRRKRVAVAEQGVALANWDYEIARANVLASVSKAFVRTHTAQSRVRLSEEFSLVAREVSRAMQARVDAGRASPVEGTRANLELDAAEIRLAQARRALASARRVLASELGMQTDAFGEVIGNVEAIPIVPDWTEVERLARNNPESARWQAEIAERESALTLERALRRPDLTISAGWRSTATEVGRFRTFDGAGAFTGTGRTSFDDDRENSFVLGFSLPLPLFDRNQGNIKEAEYLVSRATANARAGEISLSATLYETWQSLKSAEDELASLREEIVPAAEQIFTGANEGYREGKFDYLSVLDAQRTLSESRWQLTEAYAAYHEAYYELERLTGANRLSQLPADDKD